MPLSDGTRMQLRWLWDRVTRYQGDDLYDADAVWHRREWEMVDRNRQRAKAFADKARFVYSCVVLDRGPGAPKRLVVF